jgi:transaldolase
MTIEEQLTQRIAREKEREERLSDAEVWARVEAGDDVGARGSLLYFTAAARLPARLSVILQPLQEQASKMSPQKLAQMMRLLTFLAVDLRSAVPEWAFLKTAANSDLEAMAASVLQTLQRIAGAQPPAEQKLLDAFRAEAVARLKAEGLAEAQAAECAAQLTGSSLCSYVQNITEEINASNLRAAAAARYEGRLVTVLGNDYAEFLPTVIWLGGSFVTTNPVLIKLAWDIDPSYWNRQVDEVILSRLSRSELEALLRESDRALDDAVEAVVTSITISVVERNCRMLRPIFLTTGGAQGYVSLQVNPTAHDDPVGMVEEAAGIYAELERRLGGVPNVVIKVPSTEAGLQAARALTAKGIGVTITLTFSLFQSIPFAKVLSQGHALVSYIAIMNGRLAFPVRDEMAKTKTAGGVEASRWAGVEVARKVCAKLYGPKKGGGLGIDAGKVKVMIASLRIYDDWIPDVSELWGVPLITIFPNVRRAYDAKIRPLDANALAGTTPEEDLGRLLKSEIFRQAWWTESDGGLGKPERPLTLNPADSAAVSQWAPVRETLTQFIATYGEMGAMVKARMAAILQPVQNTGG